MAYLLLASALFAFMIAVQIETIVIYANNFARLRYFGRNSRFDVFSLAALALFLVGVVFASRKIKQNAAPPAASVAEMGTRRASGRSSSRSSAERKRASVAEAAEAAAATDAADATAAIPEGDEAGDEEAPTASLSSSADPSDAAHTGANAAAVAVTGALGAETVVIRVEESAAGISSPS